MHTFYTRENCCFLRNYDSLCNFERERERERERMRERDRERERESTLYVFANGLVFIISINFQFSDIIPLSHLLH